MPFNKIDKAQNSDNTIQKIIFRSDNENKVADFETGCFLRDERYDICVSTMAGCVLKCAFCAIPYSEIPFQRKLSAAEMVSQVEEAFQIKPLQNIKTLVVGFMGNGEPMSNVGEVMKAVQMLARHPRFTIKRFLMSTAGTNLQKLTELAAFINELPVEFRLQYSLFSLDNDIRQRFIPGTIPFPKASPLLDNFAKLTLRPVKYNIPLIRGINNGHEHLRALKTFILEAPELRSLKISTYNSFPNSPFTPCDDYELEQFRRQLLEYGVPSKLFFGDRDPAVFASCGQLRAKDQI